MQNKQSILVIDDSPTVRRLAELVLSEEGYDVLTAEDGDNGLKIAREKVPSLIIVDFIMPKMNGFQFCKNIRLDPALENIPIVLITSKGKDVGQGFDDKFGIVKYLQKPFETETLTNIVGEVLAKQEEISGEVTEEAADDKVPAYAPAGAKSDSQIHSQTNTGQDDISLEAINTPAITHEKDQAAAAYADSSSVNPSGVESVSAEDSNTDPRLISENNAAPDGPPVKDGNAIPFHVAIQENIEKEFRHYFGQELALLLKSTIIQSLKETDLVRSSRRILSGEIMYISTADLLSFVSKSGLSGKLSVLTDSFNSDIYLENGQIAYASLSKPGFRTNLEQLIFKNGRPMKREILSALSEARGNSLTAGNIMLKRGLISENELMEYYKRLSEDAVQQTLSASSGSFYIEDIPLPEGILNINLDITSIGPKE